MEEFLNFLDLRWTIIEIIKIYEYGDLIKYQYRIDNCNDDECGILEMDKEDIARIGRKENVNLMELLINGKMRVIQEFTGSDKLNVEGFDLSVVLTFYFIVNYYLKNDYSFLQRVEYLNYKIIDDLKARNPEAYKEMMEIINEEERRLKN